MSQFKCPGCGVAGKITNTKTSSCEDTVYRRKLCHACGLRFVTWETHDPKFHVPRAFEKLKNYPEKRKSRAKNQPKTGDSLPELWRQDESGRDSDVREESVSDKGV